MSRVYPSIELEPEQILTCDDIFSTQNPSELNNSELFEPACMTDGSGFIGEIIVRKLVEESTFSIFD